MSKNDGGPAFPRAATPNTGALAQEGMSLRDYFAGQVAPAVIWSIREHGEINYPVDQLPAKVATHSYRIADAMLAEREKGDG